MPALAVLVGLAIGVTLGAIGGGGSILTVPALVYLLGQDAHEATAASLVIVGATALAGTVAHHRAGRVRPREGIVFGVLGVAGSVVGSKLSSSVSSAVLLVAFSLLMLVAAAAMAHRARHPVTSTPRRARHQPPALVAAGTALGSASPIGATAQRQSAPVVFAAASAVGLLTGFFGVGGGFVVVPALVLVLGFEMPVAVGTSLLVIAINSAAALVTRLGTPAHLDWGLIGTVSAAAIAGSVVGARLATAFRPQRLMGAFTALLVVPALYTLARSLPHV